MEDWTNLYSYIQEILVPEWEQGEYPEQLLTSEAYDFWLQNNSEL